MVKIKKFNEILDKPLPYEQIASDRWRFELGNERDSNHAEYVVDVLSSWVATKAKEVLITHFMEKFQGALPPDMLRKLMSIDSCPDIVFYREDTEGTHFKVTDTGEQFTILSTVVEIITKEILSQFKVPLISFSAKEKSRERVYRTLVERFIKQFPDIMFLGEFEGVDKEMVFYFMREKEMLEWLKSGMARLPIW